LVASMRPRVSRADDTKSYFLVASPEMGDPVFRNSVILMVPTIQPPLVAGVIVNEPTGTSAHEVFPNFPALKDNSNSAYFGGPVDNGAPTLLVRSSHPPARAIQVIDDLYASTDADSIARILKGPTSASTLRIFLGRAQWLPEQLHAEIMEGAWYVMPADSDQVFSADPTHLWRKLVARGQLQETRFLRLPQIHRASETHRLRPSKWLSLMPAGSTPSRQRTLTEVPSSEVMWVPTPQFGQK
jgi:putative transcriptional regulator